MTPYFRRSMSPMERHGCRGRGEILSPKTHGHVLLRESRFQERVLGDQWDTYPRLEALCQSISEKRAFLGCATQWPWCHLSPKKWCRRATKFTLLNADMERTLPKRMSEACGKKPLCPVC